MHPEPDHDEPPTGPDSAAPKATCPPAEEKPPRVKRGAWPTPREEVERAKRFDPEEAGEHELS